MREFDKLLAEGVALQRQLVASQQPQAFKLTADAFITRALEIAELSREDADALLYRIVGDRRYDNVAARIRSAAHQIRGDAVGASGPKAGFYQPTDDVTRVRFLFNDDAGRAEAALLGADPLQLFALAAIYAEHAWGDAAFGECEDVEAAKEQHRHANERLDEIGRQLEAGAGIDDLHFEPAVDREKRNAGWCRVTFKTAPDVPAALPGSGRRLIEHIASRDDEAAAA